MFQARFEGGVLDGEGLGLAAPKVPVRLYLAPTDHGVIEAGGYFWIVVGVGEEFDLTSFPERVCYVLDRSASKLRPHPRFHAMEEGTAVYRGG